MIGLILGAMKLYQELGLPMLATQEHVEQKIAPVVRGMEGMRHDISQNSIDAAMQRRAQIGNSLAQWRLELQRAASDESKDLAQQRIDELTEQRDQIERHIRQLQRDTYGVH